MIKINDNIRQLCESSNKEDVILGYKLLLRDCPKPINHDRYNLDIKTKYADSRTLILWSERRGISAIVYTAISGICHPPQIVSHGFLETPIVENIYAD